MTDWTPQLREQVSDMIRRGCNSADITAVINVSKSSLMGAKARYKFGTISRAGMVPDGFEQDWPVMSIRELGRKYGVGRSTPTRWAKHLGLPLKLERRLALEARPRRAVQPRPDRAYNPNSRYAEHVRRDDSPVGEAQRYLQRDCSVYRRPDGLWQCGRLSLSDSELILRADAKRVRDARRVA